MTMRLAQFDLVKPRFSSQDPRMKEFYDSTDYINSLAEQHEGFIWRDTDDAQGLLDALCGPGYLYTLSLWKDVESLRQFLYETPHRKFLKRGSEWFLPLSQPRVVLWWVKEGYIPTLQEACDRLTYLYDFGPSHHAFDLRHCYIPTVLY